MNKLFTSIFLLAFIIYFISMVNAEVINLSTSDFQIGTGARGMVFVMNKNVVDNFYINQSLGTATKAYLGSGLTKGNLETVNFAGSGATFTTDLIQGNTYNIQVDNSGSSYDYDQLNVAGSSSINATTLNFTSSIGDYADRRYGFSNITIFGLGATTLVSPDNNTNLLINRPAAFSCNAAQLNLLNLTLLINGVNNYTTFNATAGQNYLTLAQNLAFSSLNSYNWSCQARDLSNTLYDSGSRVFNITSFAENSQTFNANSGTLSSQTFIINFSFDSSIFTGAYGYLNYNNTLYSGVLTNDGLNNYLTSTIITPATNVNVNKTFYWNITLVQGNGSNINFISSSHNQSLTTISIDDCSVNTVKILNYTMYNEDTDLYFNSTALGLNATINLDVRLSNVNNPGQYIGYNTNKSSTPFSICIPTGILNTSNYRLDAVAQYQISGYATKYDYIVNYNLTGTSPILGRRLYALASYQLFTIVYKDGTFQPVMNALIEIEKYFVAEGKYIPVEYSLTDNYGQASAHLVLGQNKYLINVYLNGILTSTFMDINPVCNNQIIGDCKVNLNALNSYGQYVTWEQSINLNYAYVFDPLARTLVLNWQTINNLPNNVNLVVYLADALENTTICNITSTSINGNYLCNIPSSFGSTNIEARLFSNNNYAGSTNFYFGNGERNAFGDTGIFFAFIIVASLGLMMVSSSIGVIVGGVLGFIAVVLLNLINGLLIWVSLGWLVLIAILIIWKINKGGTS